MYKIYSLKKSRNELITEVTSFIIKNKIGRQREDNGF